MPVQVTVIPEDESEAWKPHLFPKQEEILTNNARILLVSGPRYSGKSIGIAHKCIMRAWEIWSANIGVVVSSYKVATGGGSWQDLVIAAKEWAESGVESEYGHTFEITSVDPETNEPGSKLDKNSRTPFISIRNKFGNESVIRLISIDNENEIEQKTRSGRFQYIWVVELSNFLTRKVITEFVPLLRPGIPHIHGDPNHPGYLPDDQLQLVSDTNPAPDGKQNWIYRYFYSHDYGHVPEKDRPAVERFAKARKAVLEIFIEDNPFLPADKRDELTGLYAGDPIEYQRYVEGIWPDGATQAGVLFADVFLPTLQCDGYIEPDELTDSLFTGWDLGPQNKAWALLERRYHEGRSIWCVLDELVYVGIHVPTDDFTYQVMTKLKDINAHYAKLRANFRGFKFEHWSDNSSWSLNITDESGTEELEVQNASNGQIELQPVIKGSKSVEVSVQILRKLMREERFFVGSNCVNLKESLNNIKRPAKSGKTVDPTDKRKHILDAVRYPIFMMEVDEMTSGPIQPKFRNRRTMSVALM